MSFSLAKMPLDSAGRSSPWPGRRHRPPTDPSGTRSRPQTGCSGGLPSGQARTDYVYWNDDDFVSRRSVRVRRADGGGPPVISRWDEAGVLAGVGVGVPDRSVVALNTGAAVREPRAADRWSHASLLGSTDGSTESRADTEAEWSAKQAGVVYTPSHVVAFMLDDLLPNDLGSIRICEPACGDGAFLAGCVQRICEKIIEFGPQASYVESLKWLTGFEIDDQAVEACKARLTGVCAQTLGSKAPSVDWQIRRLDILSRAEWRRYANSFDYVVGNPPYVRIQHLEHDRREQIASGGWRFMNGCGDLYFLFFEAGLDLLREGGQVSFITPNSWLKSAAGRTLRTHLSANHRVRKIVDFEGHQVFPSVTTYTAIARVEKGGRCRQISAAKAVIRRNAVVPDNGYSVDAHSPMWTLTNRAQRQKLHRLMQHGIRLGDIAAIRVGLQTLADRVFILTVVDEDDTVVMCTDGSTEVQLEKGSVRRIYKASVMKNGKDPEHRVAIYPYNDDGQLVSFTRLRRRYPLASKWLLRRKQVLLGRDKGRMDERKWHGYGRHVGIRSAFGIKILTSGMNKRPNFQICSDADTLFYSGYAIKPTRKISLTDLVAELNSDRMHDFIKATSKPYQGGWWSYSKTFVQHFPVDRRVLRDD